MAKLNSLFECVDNKNNIASKNNIAAHSNDIEMPTNDIAAF
jgi:hypothetical protein